MGFWILDFRFWIGAIAKIRGKKGKKIFMKTTRQISGLCYH
jgi:hypothetical protein